MTRPICKDKYKIELIVYSNTSTMSQNENAKKKLAINISNQEIAREISTKSPLKSSKMNSMENSNVLNCLQILEQIKHTIKCEIWQFVRRDMLCRPFIIII